jgi:biopolymer transport protein ExbB/TolQ
VLCLIYFGPFRQTVALRYVSHPVECVEVVMFCMAVGALAAKMKRYFVERRACRSRILPAWDGRTVAVSEAANLLHELDRLPERWHDTWIAKRAAAVLEFLRSRGSADELDDHLRSLADNDAVALEASYSLTRFITWAIPILGFLGTVLGITGAISGVTPEKLEQSLGTVTDGLALAFDTTALALGLTMLTMFLSFIVERGEQSILEHVDRFVDRELAHRFERIQTEGGEFVEVARRHNQLLVQAVEQLVQRQTTLWAEALAKTDQQWREADKRHEERFTAALETAIGRTLDLHTSRLTAVEKQVVERCSGIIERLTSFTTVVQNAGREHQVSLSRLCQQVGEYIEAATRLAEEGKRLHNLQETLNQNLASLAETGTFEEALHSLTAAIHLLTARAAPASSSIRPINRTGTAA